MKIRKWWYLLLGLPLLVIVVCLNVRYGDEYEGKPNLVESIAIDHLEMEKVEGDIRWVKIFRSPDDPNPYYFEPQDSEAIRYYERITWADESKGANKAVVNDISILIGRPLFGPVRTGVIRELQLKYE